MVPINVRTRRISYSLYVRQGELFVLTWETFKTCNIVYFFLKKKLLHPPLYMSQMKIFFITSPFEMKLEFFIANYYIIKKK